MAQESITLGIRLEDIKDLVAICDEIEAAIQGYGEMDRVSFIYSYGGRRKFRVTWDYDNEWVITILDEEVKS